MSRVVNPNNPGKIRNQNRRTIAELLRRLSQQQKLDQDAMDMAAAIAIALRQIDESIMVTVAAWEKRDYWTKADRFMREWEWAGSTATEMEAMVREEDWGQLPLLMAQLFPYFADVNIKKMTRTPADWMGSHRLLRRTLAEAAK